MIFAALSNSAIKKRTFHLHFKEQKFPVALFKSLLGSSCVNETLAQSCSKVEKVVELLVKLLLFKCSTLEVGIYQLLFCTYFLSFKMSHRWRKGSNIS